MITLVLEIATEGLEGRRTNLEERMLGYVNQTRLDPESTAVQMDEDYGSRQYLPFGEDRRMSTRSHLNQNFNAATNQNQNAIKENAKSISVQNPVPSPKKRPSLLDVFRGFKSRRKHNPAVQLTYSDSSETTETESDSSEGYEETSNLLQGDLQKMYGTQQSNITVPPPPTVPPLSSARFSSISSSENSTPRRLFKHINWNMNSSRGSEHSLPTILEENVEENIDMEDEENINNNMGMKPPEETPILEEDIWLGRLRDALSESNLNLVIEDDNVILETPPDTQLTGQSRESLVESLQGLLLICKDRNQATMLNNIIGTLQQIGVLGVEEQLMSDLERLQQVLPEGPYPMSRTESEQGDIDIAWRKVWINDAQKSPTKGHKVIADRDSVKDFTIKLCEKIAQFAKQSVETGNVNVPLEGVHYMLRSFLASNLKVKTIKPHQAYFLENIAAESIDPQRRHSDCSLNDSGNKEDMSAEIFVEKCSSETSVLSGKTNKNPATGLTLGNRPSITDIHEQMGLRPVTRKLSDSVMCVAFDKNSALVEQRASEILRQRSESRENILNEMSTEVLQGSTGVTNDKKEEREEEVTQKPVS